jgi:hypothetical protein
MEHNHLQLTEDLLIIKVQLSSNKHIYQYVLISAFLLVLLSLLLFYINQSLFLSAIYLFPISICWPFLSVLISPYASFPLSYIFPFFPSLNLEKKSNKKARGVQDKIRR